MRDVFREATGKDAKVAEINGSRVFMALSGMGAGGVGGSQESVRKAIEALAPSAVIMVGIAFGIDKKKQALGDVLVSERLMLYDLQRRGTDKDGNLHVIPRGDSPSSSPRLLDWLRIASLNWKEAKVRFGLLLSGQHLVDNTDYRDELLALEEEAIGGEMEGGGLYAACQNSKKDWILVKAICDWADGKKGSIKLPANGRPRTTPRHGLPYARRAVEIFSRLPQPSRLALAQDALEACGG